MSNAPDDRPNDGPDDRPDDRLLRLNAALDGELDAANLISFERDLRSDPALAARYRELEALRAAVRRHAVPERAPAALVDRVMALASPTVAVLPARSPRRPYFAPPALALAASLGVLGFVAGSGLTILRTPHASDGVAAGLVSDFARAEIAGQPFDVASSDRHTVKPWLAQRTTVSADVVDLAPQGFPLAGGRVAVVGKIPAPTLVYRHNEHMVAVTELPLDALGAETGAQIETHDGYHVARWADQNLAYVAVSDMDEKTLAEFVATFRQATKPAGEGPAK
jgi:anti-sigma factor RsiW